MKIGQAVIHAEETIDRFMHTTFNIPTRAKAYEYAAYDGLGRLATRTTSGRISEPLDSANA